MKRRIIGIGVAFMLLLAAFTCFGPIEVEGAVTEDMLNTEIPADYVINEATQGKARDGEYDAYFLDDEIQVVSIEIDENNLQYLFENAADKPSVMAESVTIGDATVKYCGLKTKGSYTLEHSVKDNPNSDRYSFTVNFGKYIKKAEYGDKQNFFGCNKISFNNFFFDKSMMKEFFSLKLMDEMGLPTPQYGLAKLYINGDYYGVYAMVEAMDSSILQQYYDCKNSELSSYLCKPENTNFLYSEILEDPSPLWEEDDDTYADVEDMIPTVTEWVRKLNLLSEGKDFDGNRIDVNSEEYLTLLDQVMDTDETVKYFAVHSWLCQIDNMFDGQKNFGLYVDSNGRSLMVPWDYDLAFGCFFPSTPERTANYDIDLMFKDEWINTGWGRGGGKGKYDSVEEVYSNYPLFNVIYQNSTLMEKYHTYMRECSQIAALGGTVASTGKTYDPAYFNSYIDKFSDILIEAASEELADNVYYMNGISQPSGVKAALPNLGKIIAMRAMGVVLQVDGSDAIVSSKGCALETLGNALNDFYNTNWGRIVSIDYQTGIYLTGDYDGSSNSSPILSLKEVSDEKRTELLAAANVTEENVIGLYEVKTSPKPSAGYTLSIPMKAEYLDDKVSFCAWNATAGSVLDMTIDGNIYSCKTEAIDYLLIARGESSISNDSEIGSSDNSSISNSNSPDDSSGANMKRMIIPVVIANGIALVCILTGVMIVLHNKKRKKTAETENNTGDNNE